MTWDVILILECIGFPMAAIPIIVLLFTRYDGHYANYWLMGYHYDNEKIMKVWQLILFGLLAILPIINIITCLCLIANVFVNFGLGIYKWDKSTVLYKFLSKKV